ncbi:hypothetical protein TBLA_0B04190 [Henningerozyma blattae CBS 6284]|uniref:Genetic interactor of prohibitins 3, mitochondrial n=1 Tax=Henningerozyma blattae (strain ATCC 34711 / CBS 6284 / DSM 70876 / NBRC 10599 / NRRL Y-10934 / UCD 77-7) TaxID=1071380 RepID=I2GYQ5_HENB6|nr:hypothetical protein TBLA_0B04190 [Tetrapisispora blattae CBS 6284]CCH59257.1 hypothetical protein TBLA_0B04190 [Tetrapisispora blattae CBS 6284]
MFGTSYKLVYSRLISVSKIKISKRLINCHSCGIKLQDKNSEDTGYYIKPKVFTPKGINQLDEIRYLLYKNQLQNMGVPEQESMASEIDNKKDNLLICKRCNDAINHNNYKLDEFRSIEFRDLEKYIQSPSNIVNVVPLTEFPFHFERRLFENPDYTSSLLLTKCDTVIKDRKTLSKSLPSFIKSLLKKELDININKIVGISSIKSWNLANALSMMKNHSYLVGHANAGKSTLINSLIERYFGYKITKGINSSTKEQSIDENKRREFEANPGLFIKKQYSGVSHIPNLTRDILQYRIFNKVIFDLPGYSRDYDKNKLDSVIKKDWLDRIRKTNLFKIEKIRKKRYRTILGNEDGACYTIGGIFYLIPPSGTINQIIKYIPGEGYNFKNIESGITAFNNCNNKSNKIPHPLTKYCGIKDNIQDKGDYVRHVIPPFQGSIEIVLKDIGYLLLRTTGTYQYRGLHEIWCLRGIEVCIREPIENMNDIEFSNRPLISDTYEMGFEVEDTFNRMKEMYIERTEKDRMKRRFLNKGKDLVDIVKVKHNESPNLFWYFQW